MSWEHICRGCHGKYWHANCRKISELQHLDRPRTGFPKHGHLLPPSPRSFDVSVYPFREARSSSQCTVARSFAHSWGLMPSAGWVARGLLTALLIITLVSAKNQTWKAECDSARCILALRAPWPAIALFMRYRQCGKPGGPVTGLASLDVRCREPVAACIICRLSRLSQSGNHDVSAVEQQCRNLLQASGYVIPALKPPPPPPKKRGCPPAPGPKAMPGLEAFEPGQSASYSRHWVQGSRLSAL